MSFKIILKTWCSTGGLVLGGGFPLFSAAWMNVMPDRFAADGILPSSSKVLLDYMKGGDAVKFAFLRLKCCDS